MFKLTVGIDGMRCGMCETHMEKAIKENIKVKKTTVSHTDGKAVIITCEDVSEERMTKIVSDAGYAVTSFKTEPYEKKGLFCFKKV